MEELIEKLAALEMGTGDDDELFTFLEATGMRISKSAIKKAMRQQDSYKCLSCLFYADSVKELRTHLKKEKHIKPKDVIKGQMTAFLLRIEKKYCAPNSINTSLHPFDANRLAQYSSGEKRTFIAVCLEFSRMIHFGSH